MVELLIERGADLNSRNNKGPAIILAANKGHEEIVTMLLSRGAQHQVRDWQGLTLKQVAELRGLDIADKSLLKKTQ